MDLAVMVDPEHVAIGLDRFATGFRTDSSPDDVDIYFGALRGLPADCVLGVIDTWLMTEKWHPRPSEWRDAAIALERAAIEENRSRALASPTPCGFCKGHLWGPGSDIEHGGYTYTTTEPCEKCAPALYDVVIGLNRRLAIQARATVSKDSTFGFKIGDSLVAAHDELVAASARFDADLKQRKQAAREAS